MTLQDLGTFNHNGVNSQKFKNVTTTQPRDVFKFEITEERSINLLLTDANNTNDTYDDLDLALYRDNNGNGTLQQFGFYSDELISTSANGGSATSGGFAEDHINRWSQPGTYFAVVELYGSDSTSPIQYNLHVAASRQSILTGPPNTLAQEHNLGDLNHYYYDDQIWSGSVGFQRASADDNGFKYELNEVGDTSDLYYFNLEPGHTVDITLSGLASNADIRLIEDFDNDRRADPGEDTSGTDDMISVSDPGKYYLQVYPVDQVDQIEYELKFDVH